jgi:PAS domain S-box-containing protein
MTRRPTRETTGADRLEVLSELASLINTTFDFTEILRTAILKLQRVLEFRRASVTLVSEDRTYYYLHTLYDANRGGFQENTEQFPINSGLPGKAIRTGEAMRVTQFHGTQGIRTADGQQVSAMIVPLHVGAEVIGSLNLGAPDNVKYRAEDLELAVLLGRQIETSLRYSKLLATIDQQREDLAREHVRVQWQRTRLEALIEAGESAILMASEGHVVHVNHAMAGLLGLPKEVLLGASLEKVHDVLARSLHDPAALAAQQAAMRSEEPLRDRVEFGFPRPMVCQRAVDPVRGETGAVLGHLLVYRDITREADAEAAKGEFVSLVSHELRTPLTSIKTSLSLLDKGAAGEVTAEMREYLGIGLRNLERMIKLVDDLLDLSRIEGGRLVTDIVPVSLEEHAARALEVVRGFALQRDVVLEYGDTPEAVVLADSDRLEQVLVNLLSNAIKFSPRGGRVGIQWGVEPEGAVIEISDEGPGIPEDQIQAVFEKFRQLDRVSTRIHGGAGLGLHISRAIVEQFDGTMWAESSEGDGSRFYVRLPLAKEPAPKKLAPEVVERPGSVLLVEPDPDLALVFQTQFEEAGSVVTVVAGGSEGLDRVQEKPPDVVVIALELPDMHGLEFLQRLRAIPETADTPAILLGGDTSPTQAVSYGADACLAEDGWGVVEEAARIAGATRRHILLLVEDDPAQRGALARMFRRSGYACIEAANGEDALALARRRAPDAVIADLHLPGKNGLQVLQQMRADPALRSVPALLVSGYASREAIQAAADLGAEFLAKPMDWTVIVQTIRRLVGSGGETESAETSS